MPKAEPAKGAAASDLSQDQVLLYLRANPGFLVEHPELLALLVPPKRQVGDGIVDMQQFMVERLQSELRDFQDEYAELLHTTRENQTSQARVHTVVLALLGAVTFEHLIETLTTDLAVHLDLDVASLCVESANGTHIGPARAGVRLLEHGAVDEFLGAERDVLLRPDIMGDGEIYGGGAGLVRSDALLRLRIGAKAPPGLLGLGSRHPGTFQGGHGTELLSFLARVVERSIGSWLDLPA